jgi:hypothetical protein
MRGLPRFGNQGVRRIDPCPEHRMRDARRPPAKKVLCLPDLKFAKRGLGRSANRIFGNRVLPKDRSDQILTYLALSDWVTFGHGLVVALPHLGVRRSFGFNATLSEAD